MGSREKAIEELKRQMAQTKAKLGPERLRQLQSMVQQSQGVREADMVAYDRETALKALEIFIQNHGNPEWLRRQILEMVKKGK